jgi:hypothetical protein
MLKENRENTPMPSYPNWEMPDWLPDDELVTANGLSQDMRHWLDCGPLVDWNCDYHKVQRIGYKKFVRRYNLKPVRCYGFCQHAISREKSCAPTQRKRWNSGCKDLYSRGYHIDHAYSFVLSPVDGRQKRVDLIISQPYILRLAPYIDRMAENALVDGLDLMVSARQSYHSPGRTALIAIARPGILS